MQAVNLAALDALAVNLRERDQNAEMRQHAWDDPEWFLRDMLHCEYVAPKQVDIMESIRDYPETAVKGGNSTGKDFTTGRAALWWIYCHDQALVAVYGPTAKQVDLIIWRNTRQGFYDSRCPGCELHATPQTGLPGYMYPKAARYEVNDERFAMGFSAQTRASDGAAAGKGIEGFHNPHTLVIVTEAQSVADFDIESLRSLGPERMIMTGNPLITSGEFFQAFHSKRAIYNTITIAASDTVNIIEGKVVIPGLVTSDWVQSVIDHYGEDSPYYIARVLAEFPKTTEDAIVNLAIAEAAVARTVPLAGREAILGVDVARFGDDDSVIYRRQGAIARKIYKVSGRPTTHIAGKVLEICKSDPLIETVVVDVVGVGAGVYDILAENQRQIPKVKLVQFIGGAKAKRYTRYANRIAEAWWRMREAFSILDIEDDKDLISQITTRTYEHQGDSKILLESKLKLKARGAPSPDEADALAMTFAADATGKSVRHDRFAQTPYDPKTNPLGLDDRFKDSDTGEFPR